MEIQLAEDLSSILSFVILAIGAFVAWRAYARQRRLWKRKAKAVEAYLKGAGNGGGPAERPILQIIQDVGVTEDEAIQISFENPRIRRRIGATGIGTTGQISLSWAERETQSSAGR